jgi:hypothetical protein
MRRASRMKAIAMVIWRNSTDLTRPASRLATRKDPKIHTTRTREYTLATSMLQGMHMTTASLILPLPRLAARR